MNSAAQTTSIRRNSMKAFLTGLGLGTAVGLLLAPRKGEETRAAFAERMEGYLKYHEKEAGQSEASEQPSESEAIAEVLNTSAKHDLMSVPGIGKGTAKRIIENRPYETKEEVLEEGVVPEAILDRIKEQLVDKKMEVA
jgi:DNA uptake protein ComE-like DNA-binding protein